jgi:hypothetical protein
MMAMPSGPGAAGRKFHFFKLIEIEPRKFEAKLKSFVKNETELAEIAEKVKKILQTSGELIESNLITRSFVFRVPEENTATFMELAMQEFCIFRS